MCDRRPGVILSDTDRKASEESNRVLILSVKRNAHLGEEEVGD